MKPKKTKAPVVLVTGASQGIGAAIALAFAREVSGVRLALVARNDTKLAQVAQQCVDAGAATVATFACDVTDAAAVTAMTGDVTKAFRGGVDVLVNNAGVFAAAPFATLEVAEFDRIVATNLRSAFLVTQAFLPAMLQRKTGDIFFMSSIAGRAAYPGGTAYCAAKFGVTGLAAVLREETRETGVRVCTLFPGATWSPSWAKSGVKAARMMPAADVARAFVDVWRLSRRTVVEEIVLRPQRGDV